jgi:hypothetical protein
MKNLRKGLIFGMLLGLLAPLAMEAGTFIWTNSAGGAFETAGNWKTNNVTATVSPGTNDAAYFTLGSATRAKVTFSSVVTNTTTNLSLWKDNADNKYEFAIADGGGSAVYEAGFTRITGDWRYRGDLLISTGTLVSSQLNIEGYDALATIVLDGPGTRWRIKDYFCSQQATLNVDIRNGAKMEALAQNGGLNAKGGTVHRIDLDNLDGNRALVSHFRVSGAGSSAVFTNANASFNSNCETLLEFLDGAYGYFSNLTIGCSDTNYTPRLVVSNATLETAAFSFASVGSTRTFGTALLTAGATMTSKGSVFLDSYNVKAVTATVDNATWTFSGTELRVGQAGQDTLIVTNGGVVVGTNATASLPFTTGVPITTTNQVMVTGSGSMLKLRGVYPGGASGYDRLSPGFLFVKNGGAVVQTDPAADYFIVWSNGLVNLSNGTITNASKMRVRGRLEGTGFVSGNVQCEAAYSYVRPGNDIGQLDIGGSYTQSMGALEIQINGSTPGSGYDVLSVTNAAALTGGSVKITVIPEYQAPAGLTTYDVVTGGTLSTNGATVSLPPDAGGVKWSVAVATLIDGRKALRVTSDVRPKGTVLMVR